MTAPRVVRTGSLVMVSLASSAIVWLDARQPGQVMMAPALRGGPMSWQEAHQLGIVLTGMAELCADDRGAEDTDVDVIREHCYAWDALAIQVIADLQAAHAELGAGS